MGTDTETGKEMGKEMGMARFKATAMSKSVASCALKRRAPTRFQPRTAAAVTDQNVGRA